MRALIGIALVIISFLAYASAQGGSSAAGSIRGDVLRKGIHGEPAVLPGVLIFIHEPITKETKSSANGAFALDSLTARICQILANAPGLYPALSVEISDDTYSTIPVEISLSAVSNTTSPQLRRLKAMDCAFSRKVHRHA